MERTSSRALVALRRRVEEWRRGGGGRGSRIPEDLWREAVDVARSAGLYRTARALQFNYERLKERAGQAVAKGSGGNGSGFVALELPQLHGGAKVVVDLVGRDGEQMRIDVSGADGMDVVALAEAFWKRRS